MAFGQGMAQVTPADSTSGGKSGLKGGTTETVPADSNAAGGGKDEIKQVDPDGRIISGTKTKPKKLCFSFGE